MEHLAIDLGGRESQICIRDEAGKIVSEGRPATAALKEVLAERPKSRVVMETCAEAFAVADAARASGHEVRVVPAMLVRALGVGARGKKNDQQDARVLSEVSTRIDLPSVHVPSEQARNWKSICGTRQTMVESRTKLANCARGYLRGRALTPLRRGTVETLPVRVRKKLGEGQVPSHVERLLVVIEELTQQIRAADAELAQLVRRNPMLKRLTTAPGVGPVTAVLFAATLDDPKRFGKAHQVESYVGLVPGENSSGDRKRITSITKAGSTKLRYLLVQAAWAARRCRTAHPAVLWSLKVEQRRGRRIAVVALARKLAGILYGMWRDEKSYDAKHEEKRTDSAQATAA